MAAGEGFKEWQTGDVLTANDVNGYLNQGIWVFDDAADRTAQVTSPQEGNFSYLRDTNKLYYYTGAAWAEADTSGILPSEFAAKGDLLAGTGAGTFDNLGVGANGTVLTADSTETTGLKWVAAAGGGMTLLSTTSLTGSSVTLSTISQSYKILHLEIKGARSNTAADTVLIRFNSDTGNNYENRRWTIDGATGAGSQGTNQDYFRFAGIGTSSTVAELTNGQLDIFRYTDTTNINMSSKSAGNDGGKTIIMNEGRYIASAAITSITIGLTAYTFAAGTAYLYGVN
jgi:hypothetical protein